MHRANSRRTLIGALVLGLGLAVSGCSVWNLGSTTTVSPRADSGTPSIFSPHAEVSTDSPSLAPAAGAKPTVSASARPTASASSTPKCHETSAPLQTFAYPPYVVDNGAYALPPGGSQTLKTCGPASWSVQTTTPSDPEMNTTSNPNVYERYHLPLSTFTSRHLQCSFSEQTSPGVSYLYSIDSWLDGVHTDASTEISVWTNYTADQKILHSKLVDTKVINGLLYKVWADTANKIYQYVPMTKLPAAAIRLDAFYQDAIARGWASSSSQLDQVGFGPWISTTNGTQAKFSVDWFELKFY